MSYERRRQARIRLYISIQLDQALRTVVSQEYFWRLSSFASSLIMVGWTFHMFKLREPKFLQEVKAYSGLKQSMRSMSAMLGKEPGVRAYPLVKGFYRGRFVTVSLSSGLLRMIQRYANATSRSRNDVLATLLMEGLKLYCDSKATFLKVEGELKSP